MDPIYTRTKRSIAVVGGGIVGLCLAEALAEQGVPCWCFERGTVGAGQSGGVTRIFRHRHSNPQLVELALVARSSWAQLEARMGEQLVGDEGVLLLHGDGNESARLKRLGVAIESPSQEAVLDRMPLGETPDNTLHASFEKTGGAIRAQQAISRLRDSVAQSIVNADVQGIAQGASSVELLASDGIYEVDEVFVTAGEGTARLAQVAGIEVPEDRACHLRLTFESRLPYPLPCLLDRSNRFGEVAYGSPTPDGRGYAIGISSADGSVSVPDCEAPDPTRLVEIRARIEAYARRLLPDTLNEVTGARLCTATPLRSGDDDFHTWRQGRVTYFAGHNLFKFAPLIGSLLANSRAGQELPQALRLGRPAG